MKMTSRFVIGLAAVMVALCAQAAGDQFKITTLSSRPDMISGGDVLMQVDLPAGVTADKTAVRLNGQDVSSSLHADQSGHALIGIVSGLKIGDNKLEVSDGSGKTTEANLKNYPITGPIFSGPQEHPFVCQTQEFTLPDNSTLGPALDENCSARTVINYVYKSTEPSSKATEANPLAAPPLNLKPLTDMTALPADVAYTTTTTGDKVPFIVRVETGTINRGIYQFAVLSDPTKEPPSQLNPLAPPKEWNKRLLYSFGGGCTGGAFKQGKVLGFGNGAGGPGSTAVINEDVVGKGYGEASSTLNVFLNNCNEVLAAETAMMVKERFIKAYGPPDFMFGRGPSGGSEQQVPIADAYPGILDGIIPSMTFPDVLTNLQNHYDTELLNAYFAKAGDKFTEEQRLAVVGTGRYRDASADISRIDPRKNCPDGLAESQRYDRVKNRKGARCDVFDHNVSTYGRDPETGFARRTVDNTGVQYGVMALNVGKISPAQFIDLNEQIGGFDNDANPVLARNVGDPDALRRAYETDRMMNSGLGLGKLPIIDVRPYTDLQPKGDPHQKYYSFALRDRLQRTNGSFANDVMLVTYFNGFTAADDYAITEMDEWLTNLKKDTSDVPILQKIVNAKPADLVDSCWTQAGERIKEPQTFTGGKCNDLYPTHMSPRMAAGGPIGNDVYKCQLKPVNRKDYQVNFTDAEWARLQTVFPKGVCDWSKRGIGQGAPKGTWLSYAVPSDQQKQRR